MSACPIDGPLGFHDFIGIEQDGHRPGRCGFPPASSRRIRLSPPGGRPPGAAPRCSTGRAGRPRAAFIALMKEGRRPLRASAAEGKLADHQRPRHSHPKSDRFILPASSSKMRRPAVLSARKSASFSPSPSWTPSRIISPAPNFADDLAVHRHRRAGNPLQQCFHLASPPFPAVMPPYRLVRSTDRIPSSLRNSAMIRLRWSVPCAPSVMVIATSPPLRVRALSS